MNSFERLGLPATLVLDESELARQISEFSRRNHPDAGGQEAEFEAIRKAGAVLSVPALRIREALVMAGGADADRGAVPSAIMDLFSPVAGVLEDVSGFASERAKALSGLGRAVIDARLPALKTRLEETVARVSELEDELVSRFAMFDRQGWENCLEEMAEVARGLAFLRKWQAQLREASGTLFEALLGG
jgi:hypothetical protein